MSNQPKMAEMWGIEVDGGTERMSWEELAKTIEFQHLTQKQKLAVATYITNGYDIVNAIRTAYLCKDDHVASIMQHRFFRSPTVAIVLSRHFGTSPKQAFMIRLVKSIIKGDLTPTQIRAYELYASMNGWHSSPLLEAAKVAEKMGHKVTRKREDGSTTIDQGNVKRNIESALKKKGVVEEEEFDLSGYE